MDRRIYKDRQSSSPALSACQYSMGTAIMTTISGKYEDRIFGRTVVAQMVQLKQNFVQLKKFGETEKDEVLQLNHEVYN